MAEQDLYDATKTPNALELVRKSVEDCERRYHDSFVEKVEHRYNAYRGLAEPQERDRGSEDEDWHSNVTAPYVLQTCEGMLATMLEPSPRFNIVPRPKPEEPLEEVVARLTAVESVSQVVRYAMERDAFAQKQRPFMQQDLIAGLSVLKDYWRSEEREVTRLGEESMQITDGSGSVIDRLTSYTEQTEKSLVFDDACCEVRDVRDFFWPSQAPDVEHAEYLIDRTWQSYSKLERDADYYGYANVAKLKESRDIAGVKRVSEREMRLRNIERTKDLVEVLEYWTPERVITVANRNVVLRDKPNPFWNGRMPFVVCSAMPDAFQIPGISVVEALAQLQEMLWTLQNQRLDVVRLLANLITLIRSDVDDPDAFEWAPNAQWFVEDTQQVDTLKIDPTVASITLQAESLLKGDLQNIMGGLPFASGSESSTIDQQTATGVSIVTSIAQRLIQARKQHYLWAYASLGKHFLLLWQQFVRDERVIEVVGQKGAAAYQTITPIEIQGDYDVLIDVTADSLLRQERRAEAQALLTTAAQVQPIMAQSGAPLNLRAFMSKYLDAFDVQDKERFFLSPPPAPGGAPPASLPAPPGSVPTNGQQALPAGEPSTDGLTNVGAAAGPLAPSNVSSMSPEAAMQRLMAQRGGAVNQLNQGGQT